MRKRGRGLRAVPSYRADQCDKLNEFTSALADSVADREEKHRRSALMRAGCGLAGSVTHNGCHGDRRPCGRKDEECGQGSERGSEVSVPGGGAEPCAGAHGADISWLPWFVGVLGWLLRGAGVPDEEEEKDVCVSQEVGSDGLQLDQVCRFVLVPSQLSQTRGRGHVVVITLEQNTFNHRGQSPPHDMNPPRRGPQHHAAPFRAFGQRWLFLSNRKP